MDPLDDGLVSSELWPPILDLLHTNQLPVAKYCWTMDAMEKQPMETQSHNPKLQGPDPLCWMISVKTTSNHITSKSKVVSRGNAEIFTDQLGPFFIKDTKSSSHTFLYHICLSEYHPFPLRDGDFFQLGINYQV